MKLYSVFGHQFHHETVGSNFTIKAAAGAAVVSVVALRDRLVVYLLEEQGRELVDRKFLVLTSGDVEELPVDAKPVGTALFRFGELALHVFDLGE